MPAHPRHMVFDVNACHLISGGTAGTDGYWAVTLEEKPGYIGTLSLRLFGADPDLIDSGRSIADGEWHYIGAILGEHSARLYLDGVEVARHQVRRKSAGSGAAQHVHVGRSALASGGTLDCQGAIDSVRISSGVRDVSVVPCARFEADADTIALWTFDDSDEATAFSDSSNRANPLCLPAHQSLDVFDNTLYGFKTTQLSLVPTAIVLRSAVEKIARPLERYSLDGIWQLCWGVQPHWDAAIQAKVPGSVHRSLAAAGVISKPYFAKNQKIAAEWSNKTFWYRRLFDKPTDGKAEIAFSGLCNRATIWLNGVKVGVHEGMFDPLRIEVSGLMARNNEPVVRLDPAVDWTETVVASNPSSYQAMIPPLGIWRSVAILPRPNIRIENPFVVTRDIMTGLVSLIFDVAADAAGCGEFSGHISPENFTGAALSFSHRAGFGQGQTRIHLEMQIPDPHLWWPAGWGAQNLYQLHLQFGSDIDGTGHATSITFGLRSIEMRSVVGNEGPRIYNWTLVINGQPIFIKGAHWCTMDALLDLPAERYAALLELAIEQNIQFFRVWGCGLVETDEFYDLCDRLGIMIMQEWPTSWNSQRSQPRPILEETIRASVLRIRHHSCLALYSCGNESTGSEIFDDTINALGRITMQLDGSRPCHRVEPRGGSIHSYIIQQYGLEDAEAIATDAVFLGEFGVVSSANCQTVLNFLPEDERLTWPPLKDGSLAFHTPSMGKAKVAYESLDMLKALASNVDEPESLQQFVLCSQLVQAIGLRHNIERARTGWPACTGSAYFEFNDNCPTASLATIDWSISPKIAHYYVKRAYGELLPIILFDNVNVYGQEISCPLYFIDEKLTLSGKALDIKIRAFDGDWNLISEQDWPERRSSGGNSLFGEFKLSSSETKSAPLIIAIDVCTEDSLVARNHYFLNFTVKKGALFSLPKTQLVQEISGHSISVKNAGPHPALGVYVSPTPEQAGFVASDNFIWLDVGESAVFQVNSTTGIRADSFNA